MKAVGWMAAASLASAALAVAAAGRANAAEVLLGMIAPLLAACVSWVLTERTYRRDPPALAVVLGVAVAATLFFGVYPQVLFQLADASAQTLGAVNAAAALR